MKPTSIRRVQTAALRIMGGSIGTTNAQNRHSWVEQALRSLPAGSSILDVGAGEQPYRESCDHLRYVTHDFGQYDGQGSGVGMQTGRWRYRSLDIISDITAIPAPDGAFDNV